MGVFTLLFFWKLKLSSPQGACPLTAAPAKKRAIFDPGIAPKLLVPMRFRRDGFYKFLSDHSDETLAVRSEGTNAFKKRRPRTRFPRLQIGIGLRGLILQQNRGFPLVAAGVPGLMMSINVGVLMAMGRSLVAVLMAVVAMILRFMRMLVLMLIFVMAAQHLSLPVLFH